MDNVVENVENDKTKAFPSQVEAVLCSYYPDIQCGLNFNNPFELLVATILSAQCTDRKVNQVSVTLFAHYPDAAAMAAAPLARLEAILKPTGFFRHKAKHLKLMSQKLINEHNGQVPADFGALLDLPGVGCKTANVVLGNAFNIQWGMVVDTHVKRISYRLGWTQHSDPLKVEADICRLLPDSNWILLSHRLIALGREFCRARQPLCSSCILCKLCPQNIH